MERQQHGIGTTYLRIRGQPIHINVTLDGVPLNSPETSASSRPHKQLCLNSRRAQIQRRPGTSSVGDGAIGGSVTHKQTATTL